MHYGFPRYLGPFPPSSGSLSCFFAQSLSRPWGRITALSLDDCLALAREQNPVLSASREKIQELLADYNAARSKFFPRLVLVLL